MHSPAPPQLSCRPLPALPDSHPGCCPRRPFPRSVTASPCTGTAEAGGGRDQCGATAPPHAKPSIQRMRPSCPLMPGSNAADAWRSPPHCFVLHEEPATHAPFLTLSAHTRQFLLRLLTATLSTSKCHGPLQGTAGCAHGRCRKGGRRKAERGDRRAQGSTRFAFVFPASTVRLNYSPKRIYCLMQR